MEESRSTFIKVNYNDKTYCVLNFDLTINKIKSIFNIAELSFLEDLNGNCFYPTFEGNFLPSISNEVLVRQSLPKQVPTVIYYYVSKFLYNNGPWHSGFNEVMIGYSNISKNMRIGYIQFNDLSLINRNRKISKVYLRMVGTTHESNLPIQIFVHRCETYWEPNIINWNQQPIYREEPYSSRILREVYEIPFHWDVTDIVVDWLSGTLPNYGIAIKTNNTCGISSTKQFHNNDSVKKPCLLVYYADEEV